MYRYKFYNSDNKVVALGSFAGKTVRGVAKCDPADTFSLEDGKELAAARCEAKIAEKRAKCAFNKLVEAIRDFEKAKEHLDAMRKYYTKSVSESEAAKKASTEIFERLNKID